jgi:hypothetical protein
MTLRQITISWDDEEVATFNVSLMTRTSGPEAGRALQWHVHMTRKHNLRNVHGQSIGDVWASATHPSEATAAFAEALELLRKRTSERLASQNSRPKPEAKSLASETIQSNKSLDDLGL